MEAEASEFLRHLRIPVSQRYVDQLIQAHPQYPSLLSVSDTFHRLGLEHAVHRIDKSALIDLPYPFLLALDKGRTDLLCIKNERDLVKFNDHISDHWGGVVLQAEAFDKAKNKTNNSLYSLEREIRIILTCLAMMFLALLGLMQTQNKLSWLNSALLFTSLSGIVTSYFLMNKALGIKSGTIDNFCNAGKSHSCDRVLNSGLRFFGIEFLDLVACYFVAQFIAAFVATLSTELNAPFIVGLASLSIVSIPFVLFSWYYQKYVVRTWCRLCLLFSGILFVQWLMFGAAWTAAYVELMVPSSFHIGLLTLLLFSAGLSVLMMKAVFRHHSKLSDIGGRAKRVMHSPDVFKLMLTKQRLIDVTPFENDILLGCADAPIKLIMGTNLYCTPCKSAHNIIEELLSTYPGKISVALRFVKAGNQMEQGLSCVGYLLGYWLNNVKGRPDAMKRTSEMMHAWFELRDLKKFSNDFPLTDDSDELLKHLERQHYAWIDRNQITFTPALFVNGYQLPSQYSVEDLLDLTLPLSDALEYDIQMTAAE